MASNGFFTSMFQMIFGRRGPRTQSAPRPAPPAPPPPRPAPPPQPAPSNTAPPPAPQPAPAPVPPAPAPIPAPPVDAAPPPPRQPSGIPGPEDLLTPHFKFREFTDSEAARSAGIENTPTPEHMPNIVLSAQGMERVRALLGGKPISINSAYRNPEVNRRVGGVPNSAHALGYAVDFVCPSFGDPYSIVDHLMKNAEFMADVDQLIFELNRWVHVSFDPTRKRGQVLTAYRVPGQSALAYQAGLHRIDANGGLVA